MAQPGNSAPGVPKLLAESVRLAWRAGRRELTVMLLMQVATAGLVVAAVLVARDLVSQLLATAPAHGSIDDLLPDLAASPCSRPPSERRAPCRCTVSAGWPSCASATARTACCV